MYSFIRALLFRIDAERAHRLTLSILATFPQIARLLQKPLRAPASLGQSLWGQQFVHPVGLAAGLDKNASSVNGLLLCGFSFIEVGTVTPKGQPGNSKPRLFRVTEQDALINRMGFNNEGVRAVCNHLSKRRVRGIVGINLGKNKVTPNDAAASDYLQCLDVAFQAADYIVINVSSPNTPGLRDLQAESHLIPLVQAILSRRDELSSATTGLIHPHRPPILVKIAPDLNDDAIVHLAQGLAAIGTDGFIATNTTISRANLPEKAKNIPGGLSGRPLKQRSTDVIRLIYHATEGKVPIIGSGGVFDADDAYEKILAGASLIQVYTGFIYKGPQIVTEIVKGMAERLTRDGFKSLSEAVGSENSTSSVH